MLTKDMKKRTGRYKADMKERSYVFLNHIFIYKSITDITLFEY